MWTSWEWTFWSKTMLSSPWSSTVATASDQFPGWYCGNRKPLKGLLLHMPRRLCPQDPIPKHCTTGMMAGRLVASNRIQKLIWLLYWQFSAGSAPDCWWIPASTLTTKRILVQGKRIMFFATRTSKIHWRTRLSCQKTSHTIVTIFRPLAAEHKLISPKII